MDADAMMQTRRVCGEVVQGCGRGKWEDCRLLRG